MHHPSLLCAAALLGATTLAQAGTWADLSIIDRDDHQILKTYRYQGKTYVAGHAGNYYAVRIPSDGQSQDRQDNQQRGEY
jgi:hypothetical protein